MRRRSARSSSRVTGRAVEFSSIESLRSATRYNLDSASMYTSVIGFSEVCSLLCGRLTSMAAGKIRVDVTMKKMSRRNMTSVIDDMEKVSSV